MSKASRRRLSSSPSFRRLQADSSSNGISLAEYLSRELSLTLDEASDLIDFGAVQVGGRQERNPATHLTGFSEIRVYRPWGGPCRHYEIDPARILYRDRHLLAYDKEHGIPSQQTPSDGYNNLFAALQRYLAAEARMDAYVALHHRLDRETGGIILFSIDREANRQLGNAFQHRRVQKDYLAWVSGNPQEDQWISLEDIGRKEGRYCTLPPGEGKTARTIFTVLWRETQRTLVWARPMTGRTHQIRLHLAARGIPVLGDRTYGNGQGERLYLYSHRMTLPHPVTRSELRLIAPLPSDWRVPFPISLPDDTKL